MSKSRAVYLLSIILWAVALIAAWLYGKGSNSEPPEPVVEEAVMEAVVVVAPVMEPEVAPVEVPVEEAEEEATPTVPNPVRDDIPLEPELQQLLYQACDETGIPYELALAVIQKETGFRNIAGDGGDSIGYMQVQPRWHGDRMERLGVLDLGDPYGNFLVGCDYLAEMLEKNRGLEWALHAYNGGPSYANKMAKAERVSQYVKDVLNYMNILKMEEF